MYCHGHVKIEMNLLEAAFRTNAYPSIRVRTQAHTEIKQGKTPHKFFSVGVLEFALSCFTVTLLIFNYFLVLTLSRLMTYIYMTYRTANLQTLHFKYLFNKYLY
jgi:hypothetical protein